MHSSLFFSITTFIIHPISSQRACVETTWYHDTNHRGQRPDCPPVTVWGDTNGYMYHNLNVCKGACQAIASCNIIVRFTDNPNSDWHCYLHACPDINAISWIQEDRWGSGASYCNQHILEECITASPSESPTNPSMSPTFQPTESTSDPSISPTFEPTMEPTLDPTIEPSEYPSFAPTKAPTTHPIGEMQADQDRATTESAVEEYASNTKDQEEDSVIFVFVGLIVAGVVIICLIFVFIWFRKQKNKDSKIVVGAMVQNGYDQDVMSPSEENMMVEFGERNAKETIDGDSGIHGIVDVDDDKEIEDEDGMVTAGNTSIQNDEFVVKQHTKGNDRNSGHEMMQNDEFLIEQDTKGNDAYSSDAESSDYKATTKWTASDGNERNSDLVDVDIFNIINETNDDGRNDEEVVNIINDTMLN